MRDLFVITYGSSRWGVKFESSLVLKIFKTKDEAIYYAWSLARRHEGDVYVDEKGKFVKQKKPKD